MSVADLIACNCGQTNPAERRYCGQCGAELWCPCPQCDVPQPQSERFCGQCGLDIPRYYDERTRWCAEQLAKGRELLAAFRFDEALRVTGLVLKQLNPKLRDQHQSTRALHEEVQREQTTQQTQAAEKLERARHWEKQYAYQRAATELASIPEPLRDAPIAELLEQMRRSAEELTRLSTEIRDDLANKRVLPALDRIDRLLRLKPDHEEARRLSGQLTAKVFESARKKLGQRDFAAAIDLTRQIPASFRDAETLQLIEAATDALWLKRQAMGAPVVTRAHVRVVERLLKITAQDEVIRQLHDDMTRRLASGPDQPSLAAPHRKLASPRSSIGPPLVWFAGGDRFQFLDEGTRNTWRDEPGRFGVAAGLALQALDLVELDVNLAPREKVGLLQRLTKGRRRAVGGSVWGIDVGGASLKAVRLARGNDDRVVVERTVVLNHASRRGAVNDEIELAQIWTETVNQLAQQENLEGARVAVNLPGLYSLGRWIETPRVNGKRSDEIIAYELKARIALPLDELVWDASELDEPGESEQPNDPTALRRYFVLAAKQRIVRNRLSLLAPLKAKVEIVQSDCVALYHYLRFHSAAGAERPNGGSPPEGPLADPLRSDETRLILDIGSDAVNLLVTARNNLWFRTFGPGGDEMTRALAREFQLTFEQAERVKRDPASAASVTRWAATLNSVTAAWGREIARSLSQCPLLDPDANPATIAICLGGGAPLLAAWAPDDAERIR